MTEPVRENSRGPTPEDPTTEGDVHVHDIRIEEARPSVLSPNRGRSVSEGRSRVNSLPSHSMLMVGKRQ